MPENRQIVIASVPEGRLKGTDFEVRTEAIPECGEGQVLCRLLALTIGAGQRAGLQGSASYAGAPVAGVVTPRSSYGAFISSLLLTSGAKSLGSSQSRTPWWQRAVGMPWA